MKKFFKVKTAVALVLGSVAILGCSLENQAVHISPTLTYQSQNIGRSQPIYLNVVDKRTSRLIGHRKDETKDQADIVAANDVRAVVYDTVKQVLTNYGFVVASSLEGSVGSYTVDIMDLSYKAGGAYVAPSLDTRMLLQSTALKGQVRRSNNYEVNRSGREAKPLTQDRNAKMINDIVSQTLDMLASDRQMMEFLAAVQTR